MTGWGIALGIALTPLIDWALRPVRRALRRAIERLPDTWFRRLLLWDVFPKQPAPQEEGRDSGQAGR